MTQTDRSADAGFTLIELLMTMMVMAVMTGLAGTSLMAWKERSAQSGARDETVSLLRNTAMRSLSEGRTYCVHFTGNGQWTLYRTACDADPAHVVSETGLNDELSDLAPTFTYTPGLVGDCPTAGACAYFYPRGTASPGEVLVTRPGSDVSYTVVVEQLTSRVHVQ